MLNLKGMPCPKCGRKGLHYADHPHALGWKDPDKIVCRFCHAKFKPREESGTPVRPANATE